MSRVQAKISDLCTEIRSLSEMPIATKSELDEWYTVAIGIQRRIHDDSDLARAVPHFLHHYLSDADIRRRDAEYATAQNRGLNEILTALERGEEIDDEGPSVGFSEVARQMFRAVLEFWRRRS